MLSHNHEEYMRSEIATFKNWVKQTAMQDSSGQKNSYWQSTHLVMWELFNSLTKTIFTVSIPSNPHPQNDPVYASAATKTQQNTFVHTIINAQSLIA